MPPLLIAAIYADNLDRLKTLRNPSPLLLRTEVESVCGR